jgi:alpha-glucosidase
MLVAAALLAASPAPAAKPVEIASPRGEVRLAVFVGDGGRLSYRVAFRGRPAIEASPLGIVVDNVDLGDGVSLGAIEEGTIEDRYPWRGPHAEAVNRCHTAAIAVTHAASHTAYRVEVRVFDDGIAFRHVVPGDAKASRVPDAASAFRLPASSAVWYHDFYGHYEGIHTRKALEEVPAEQWVAPPLTAQLPGGLGYVAITEAALFGYAGMGLQADGHGGFRERLGHAQPPSYPFTLRYGDAEAKRLAAPQAVVGTITTPWRVVMVGASLDALVNSDILPSLCPPADPKLFPEGMRTSWVRPGRAVWKYLDGGGENSLAAMKDFSRMAGELGFEYNVVEGFWQRWSDADLKELVDASAGYKVGVFLWMHSKDLHDPEARRQRLDRAARAGAAGVKIDFFDHEAKEVVELYETLLRETAERHLLVDFHGANKPTGEARTWPNELTKEAVAGLEHRSQPSSQAHNTTLPFTRWLAGPADYTPVVFGERRKDTTVAHQIATAAVLTSPLLVYGAHPRSLLESPAVEVIRAIPAVWDETIVLPDSEIGEVAAFARRSGQDWFVAILNGPHSRTLRVPLSFLAGKARGVLVRDKAGGAAAVEVERRALARGDVLEVPLQPGGGFIARLTP